MCILKLDIFRNNKCLRLGALKPLCGDTLGEDHATMSFFHGTILCESITTKQCIFYIFISVMSQKMARVKQALL